MNTPLTAVTLTRPRLTFVYYLLIGSTALLVELAVFFGLVQTLRLPLALANAGAMGLGMITSFTLNSRYNFQVRDKLIPRFASFLVVTLFSYTLSTSLLILLVSNLHLGSFMAKLCVLPLVLVVQFTLNRRITFGNSLIQS